MSISRRNLLQMMGLAGASYFLPSLGGSRVANAGPTQVPKRIVFFYTEQGSFKPLWAPTAPGAPVATSLSAPWSTTAHTLGQLHQPLVKYKDRLLFLDGLDMVSATVDPTGAANAHINGESHALVADNRQDSQLAGNQSIDQFIATGLNSPKPITALPSFEMIVNDQGQSSNGEARPLYAGRGQPLPITGQMGLAYNRLFPNGPQGNTPADKAKLAKMLADQKVVLEYAKNDFSALGSRVGKADKDRLNAHAAAISDLQGRLDLGASACVEPDPSLVAGTGGSGIYQKRADIMVRLAQTALACDLTRVVTLYPQVPPDALFGYKSVAGTTDFHDMVHKVSGQGAPLANDPTAVGIVSAYHTFMAQQFANLLAALDAIPEANGGTLLDNSVVVWCGQLAAGDHSLHHMPYVLAGGLQGHFKTGRYVRYPRTPDPKSWPEPSVGPAHNDLFVSLANAMGVATSSFGNAKVCKGPLAGLT